MGDGRTYENVCAIRAVTSKDGMTADWARWEESTLVSVRLEAGRSYRISIGGDDTTINMSSFQHFGTYTAGTGGSAPFERVNVAEIRVLAR